jgi:hydrogenase maturation protein HypF
LKNHNNHIALKIKIEGLVQGVGFRPFIYKLACEKNIRGYVANLNDGVEIHAEGNPPDINGFIHSISAQKPEAADIQLLNSCSVSTVGYSDFTIHQSESLSDAITEVCPDIAVCNDCIDDMKNQSRRMNYPLINCTNCGPRFTIIESVPYDRNNTTMKPFFMCEACRNEYEDIDDRRFHAQPVACHVCGPAFVLSFNDYTISDIDEILQFSSDMISDGKTIAVKGTGGFHLMCNALDEEAVSRLRRNKVREGKPFAVMFRDMETIKAYACVSAAEEKSLLSWRRPVVILDLKKPLAPSVTSGLNSIGAFLPYMPFHHLFFEKSKTAAIVLTSGNISDEPVIIDNSSAKKNLSQVADAFITYNRDIHNRADDSVVKVLNGKEQVFRRSRGYAPAPVNVGSNVEGILACGAELTNCFGIGKNNQALLSQHIGDLKNIETYSFYIETIEKYKKLFRFTPVTAACDLHPDYLSSRYAEESGLVKIEVQHHHAHIASCMAENGLNEKVIGISFDGTGYGTDGNIWGSEFLFADFSSFERYTHFEYMVLPGGDIVVEQPWRTALSCLYKIFGNNLDSLDIPFTKHLDPKKRNLVLQAIAKKINCSLSSGAGRLFDAVAALLDVCPVTAYHAEAPMKLETIITEGETGRYGFEITNVVSFDEMIRQIVTDIRQQVKPGIIAARFHNTVIDAIAKVALNMKKESGIKKIVLSGGTFQNKYMIENLQPLLFKHNFEVFTHGNIPANDAGIALGQMVIASERRK